MVASTPRITGPTRAVLEAFLEHREGSLYGLQVGALSGLPSGTVHPILARLEALGWVESRWEPEDPVVLGRPRRRFYRMTDGGAVAALAALRSADARRARVVARLPRPVVPGSGA